MVEFLPSKQAVEGSSPFFRSTFSELHTRSHAPAVGGLKQLHLMCDTS